MILHGDCLDVLPTLEADSIEACVTDPPYGLEFMGKEWDRLDGDAWRSGGGFSKPGIGERPTAWASFGAGDTANATCGVCGGRMRGRRKCGCEEPEWMVKGKRLEAAGTHSRQAQGRKMQAWHDQWAREVYRVLKPGGHLLAFGGTRTYHRLACAIEDAGFEVRDCLMWIYGSGFPKSLDVSKAIDKEAGAERAKTATIARRRGECGRMAAAVICGRCGKSRNGTSCTCPIDDGPVTDLAVQWRGWGTALKPAYEPILLARKPLAGTVAQTVVRYGTGAINIDGCRVCHANADDLKKHRQMVESIKLRGGSMQNSWKNSSDLSGANDVTALGRWPANVLHDGSDEVVGAFPIVGYADSGSAARFFYCAKASRSERERGLNADNGTRANHHPTVKPLALMRYLVRLVTPPGGTVLDPFAGSGSTLVAAVEEGFDCLGIEQDAEYVTLATARLRASAPLFSHLTTP